MENNKITQEELKEIQTVVEQYENISFRIGQYTIEIESVKADRNTMINQASELLKKRSQILKQFEEKYGRDVKVNIQNGDLIKE
jgi:uncharacterized protein involved in exopolysaccharide biosynthesis